MGVQGDPSNYEITNYTSISRVRLSPTALTLKQPKKEKGEKSAQQKDERHVLGYVFWPPVQEQV